MNLSHEEALERGSLIRDSLVAQCLGLLGDRWTLLAIRDLFLGRHRFEELLQHTGAVRSTLANRLKVLVAQGIVYRNPYQTVPLRYEYRLTPKGLGLYNFALAVWHWEHLWSDKAAAVLPPRLYHRGCSAYFTPVCSCARCDQSVTSRTVSYRTNPAYALSPVVAITPKRRSKVKAVGHRAKDGSLFHAMNVLGDRWNNLILGGSLYGLKRYDDFQRGLGISTNILAHRLKLLVGAQLLDRVAYQSSPRRYQYNLTQKGRDYLPIAVALHNWSEKWLTKGQVSNVILSHSCAPDPLKVAFSCSHCAQVLAPHDVSLV